MKKFSAKTVISVMSLTLFALMLVDAYLDHKQDIDESVARLKTTLKPAENAQSVAIIGAETEQANTEGDTANG
ncbi:MAG: hypothetical protein IKT61_00050 [Clostridia bacterium]|nr:hypothetical protein [Clostridia bacterium]